ncbi:MAG: adenylosuccinate synthase [Nanoarchaeota archaeon]
MNIAITGCQWGDEGKGKIVDLLAEKADYVVRYNGGGNAGHTLVVNGKTTILHYVPSGVLRDKICVIGNGTVISLEKLKEEINKLKADNINPKIFISELANIILPEDMESSKTEKAESTGRGIRPTYIRKAAREGIRMIDILNVDFLHEDISRDKVKENIDYLKEQGWAKPLITNVSKLLNDAIKENKNILFEGAQGTWLDVDFGSHPYTTSSNAVVSGAPTGSGIGPHLINKCLGVVKAYITRVDRTGISPLPTQDDGEGGNILREKGGEFGATTGRPRRCGWQDIPVLRHSILVNGFNSLILTKLDVLDHLEELKICTKYEINGKEYDIAPADGLMLRKAKPIYETLPGWKGQTTAGIKNYDDLPENAKKYIKRIEELTDAKFSIICTGAERNDIIVLEDPWS